MHIKNVACIDCSSSDALSLYRKEGYVDGYCNSSKCEDKDKYKSNKRLRESYLDKEMDLGDYKSGSQSDMKKEEKVLKAAITKETVAKIIAKTQYEGDGFRGQDDDILKEYRVRTEFNDDGEVVGRYYPVFEGLNSKGKPKLVAFKKRLVSPKKDFRAIGRIDKDTSDLFGEWKCKGYGKYIVLVGGEEDVLAARAIINKYKKEDTAAVDVVCSTISETSFSKQIQRKYEFFDGYDNVIIAMDMDDAGESATEKLLDVLPAGKTKVMYQPANDANECLEQGLGQQWMIQMYQAFKPKLSGITGSSELLEDMYNNVCFEKLPLPPFMSEFNDMLEGGYDFGTFNLIAGDTSVGKSTLVNEIASYIIECGEHKPVILSLEAKKSVLARQYLSLHLGKRLGQFRSKEELQGYIEDHQDKVDKFLMKDGDNTFEVIDDRARLTSIEDTFKMIEKAIRGLGCRVIIIDVLTDLMDSLTNEQQALFNGRLKALIACHNVCIIGICHTRKLEGNDKEGKPRLEPTRFDVYGSKTTIASATTLMLIWRDLQANDEEERNTTYAKCDKNRDHSVTGRCGTWLYTKETHRMHNKIEMLERDL